MDAEYFKTLLRKKGLKVTNQRMCVLEAVASCPGKHLTAEEIFGLVQKNHPEVGLATIYRTLQLLAELDMITKINFDDGFVRYEIRESDDGDNRHCHHHLICKGCGAVLAFEDDLLEKLEETIQNELGFCVVDHEVKFYGYCRECSAKKIKE